MVKTKIETSGDVREFLAHTMLGIKNGHIDTGKAIAIVKAAQQMNESFYSEIKMKQVSTAMGEATHALGKLPVA